MRQSSSILGSDRGYSVRMYRVIGDGRKRGGGGERRVNHAGPTLMMRRYFMKHAVRESSSPPQWFALRFVSRGNAFQTYARASRDVCSRSYSSAKYGDIEITVCVCVYASVRAAVSLANFFRDGEHPCGKNSKSHHRSKSSIDERSIKMPLHVTRNYPIAD